MAHFSKEHTQTLVTVLMLPVMVSAALGQAPSRPLRFVGNSQLPPIISSQHGQPVGLVVDLANAVARKAGLSIRVDAMDWAEAQCQVLSGQADALLQVNPTPEREKLYDFSEPLLQSQFHLFRKNTRTDIQDLPSLYGKRVGVEAAGFPIQYLQAFNLIKLVVISDWKTGFDLLRTDQLDAVFADRWVGEYVLSINRMGGVIVVEPAVVSDKSRIAVKKGSTDLLARINAGLQAVNADGTRTRILEKWQAKEVVYLTRESIHRMELYAGLAFMALLIVASGVSLSYARATRKVNRQLTGEIQDRARAEAALEQARDTLEQRVAARTAELQQSVANLRMSEEKFALAFAGNSAAIAITSLEDGLFMEVNDTWLALNGYTREEVIGRSARTMHIWPTEQAATRFVQQLQETGSIRGLEQEFCRKTGDRFVAKVSATVLTMQGQPVILSTLVDITDRIRAEKAQEAGARLLQDVMDGSTSPIFLKDCDGRFILINAALERMLGRSRGELKGKTDYDIAPKGIADSWRSNDRKVMETGQPLQTEEVADLPDGHHVFLSSKFPLIGADNQIYGIGAISHDITERKQGDDALRESHNRFAVLTRNVDAGVALIDEHGKFAIVNAAFLRLFDLPGESSVKNINDRDWGQWQVRSETGEPLDVDEHPVRKAVMTGRPVRNKLVAVQSPSHFNVKWMRISAEPILKPNGRMDAVICTYHDVTEIKRAEEAQRKRAQEALRMSEHEFYSLAESMPQIVWATRPDGWNIYFNHQWLDYTGMTMEASFGHGWNKPFHPEDRQRAWEAWQRATQHNEPYSLECRLRRADGAYRWWLIRGSPMRGENGEILKWFGTCTDIEEMKRAEAALLEYNDLLEQRVAERTAALRANEARYRAIGESIDYGIWSCDAQGRNTYASDSFLKLVGITQEQCAGLGWGDLLHPDDIEATIAAWKQCVQSGGQWYREHRFRGADGKWHPILACGVAVRNERNEVTAWSGINLDISQLKRTEESLQASIREKEVLLKEVHHRVKNNLQVISSLANLQADTIDNPALRTAFNGLRDQVRSMAMVHEKLYQTENLASVDFAEYARSLLNYLWRAYGESTAAIRLTLDLQPVVLPLPMAVSCGLLLNELATNAIKYAYRGREGGELTVALNAGPDGNLRLRVSDNGVGLPPALDWRHTRSLGLQLVQMLTTQLGGTVELRQDGGTEFRIVFQQVK